MDDHPLREYIPLCWAYLIKIKDAHYKAIAHYYAALIHEKLAVQCNGKIRRESCDWINKSCITTMIGRVNHVNDKLLDNDVGTSIT